MSVLEAFAHISPNSHRARPATALAANGWLRGMLASGHGQIKHAVMHTTLLRWSLLNLKSCIYLAATRR